MSDYITPPLTTEPDDILDGEITDYQARVPDWVPQPGSPLVMLMAIISMRLSVNLDVASQVFTSIFRSYGSSIAGVPPIDAVPSTSTATFTMTSSAVALALPFVIPAGTRVSVQADSTTDVVFATEADVTVPASTTTATAVIAAAVPGLAGNGLAGAGTMIDPLDFVQSVSIAATSGGADGETDPEYLDRLTRRLRRLSPKIITAADAETAILDDVPGVGRVLILDEYVPAGAGPEQFDVPGYFTIVPTQDDGTNVTGPTVTAIGALIDTDRILGVAYSIINPTRTGVTAAYTATAYAGFDPVAVKADCDAAVTAYFYNGAGGWGTNDTYGGGPTWVEDLTVRFSELYAVINNVIGVNHVTDVKINGVSNTDATIPGPGALPTLTSVTGTVT